MVQCSLSDCQSETKKDSLSFVGEVNHSQFLKEVQIMQFPRSVRPFLPFHLLSRTFFSRVQVVSSCPWYYEIPH